MLEGLFAVHFTANVDSFGRGVAVFTPDGKALQGLTGARPGENVRRAEFPIPAECRKKGQCDIYIELSCNELFGQKRDDVGRSDPNRKYVLECADLIVINMEALFQAYGLT